MIGEAYEEVDGYEAAADLQLGCGILTEHAGLDDGHAVVDLGSGAGLYAGCVAGSMEENAYLELIEAAGFEDVQIRTRSRIEVPDSALPEDLSEEPFTSFREGGLFSLTIRGRKPE